MTLLRRGHGLWLILLVAGVAVGFFATPVVRDLFAGPPGDAPIRVEPAPALTEADKALAVLIAVDSAEAKQRLAGADYTTTVGPWSVNDETGKLVQDGAAVTFWVKGADGQFYGKFLVGVELSTRQVRVYELDGTKPKPPQE